jgi:hypothetical protein
VKSIDKAIHGMVSKSSGCYESERIGDPAAAVQPKPVLEPKAIEILKALCDRLAAARSMSFTAEVTYESPSRMGFPLAYTTKSEVVMQRPDKLRVITLGDGPASESYYDGKNHGQPS